MPTTKKRINITLPRDVERALTRVAKRDALPEATKAALLLERALEIEEDVAFDRLASERLRTAKKWLSSSEVWK